MIASVVGYQVCSMREKRDEAIDERIRLKAHIFGSLKLRKSWSRGTVGKRKKRMTYLERKESKIGR